MKKLILIIGTSFVLLNSIAGLTISSYTTINFISVNISIILSVGIIFFTAYVKLADGFKIGLTAFFILTGIVRCFLLAFAPPVIENNVLLLVSLGILLFEVMCISSAYLANKNR